MTLTVGIDLGTTNSCIAFHDGARAEVIPTPEGLRIMPSVVFVAPDESATLAGVPAVTGGKEFPDFCYRHVKRLFGVTASDEDAGWQTAAGADGKLHLKGPNGALYDPAEIAGRILSELLDCAEFRLGERPTDAVIGVPADFKDPQRAAVLRAAEYAGINATLIHEPTAAAIAYNADFKKIKHAIVYDWGGGTFDITVLQAGRDFADVKASRGNSHLGGVDIDSIIVDKMCDRWLAKYGTDLRANNAAMVRLWEAAERAKRELTARDTAIVDVPFIETIPARSLREAVSRAELEEWAAALIEETIDVCRMALDAAGLEVDNIGEVILVGGMTRMPLVAKRVGEFFKRKPRIHQNPDEVVALGAATKAALLDHRISDFAISDKSSHDFGVETLGDNMAKIIRRGTPVPAEITRELRTVRDGQEKISVHVIAGDHHKASENTRVIAFDVDVPPAPAGEQRIELTFMVDENNIGRVMHGDVVKYDGAKS